MGAKISTGIVADTETAEDASTDDEPAAADESGEPGTDADEEPSA